MSVIYNPNDSHISDIDPTSKDDINAGFYLGGEWLNTTTGNVFYCTDNTTGSAIWRRAQFADEGIQSYAHMYRVSAQTTTGISANTYKKANLTTNAGMLSGFTHSDNRLTYTGSVARAFHVQMNLNIGGALLGDVFRCGVAKNGTVQTGITAGLSLSLGAQAPISASGIVSLSTNEYIEIWVKTALGTNFVISEFTLTII